jgi:hypothetical protein
VEITSIWGNPGHAAGLFRQQFDPVVFPAEGLRARVVFGGSSEMDSTTGWSSGAQPSPSEHAKRALQLFAIGLLLSLTACALLRATLIVLSLTSACTDEQGVGDEPFQKATAPAGTKDGAPGCARYASGGDRLRLPTTSHVHVRTIFSDAVAFARLSPDRPHATTQLSSSLIETLAARLRSVGRDPAVFATHPIPGGIGPDDLVILQCVELGRAGEWYRLLVTAEQKGRRWHGFVHRKKGESPHYRGIADETGRTRGDPLLESLQLDSIMLAERLSQNIDLERGLKR